MLHGWCHVKLLPSGRVLGRHHPTTRHHMSRHFMQSHIRRMHACLAVTCHLHFWRNDRDFLRATAVTRGWNGYRNKSTKSSSQREREREFSRHSWRDSNPRPFNHESGALTTELSPLLCPCFWRGLRLWRFAYAYTGNNSPGDSAAFRVSKSNKKN